MCADKDGDDEEEVFDWGGFADAFVSVLIDDPSCTGCVFPSASSGLECCEELYRRDCRSRCGDRRGLVACTETLEVSPFWKRIISKTPGDALVVYGGRGQRETNDAENRQHPNLSVSRVRGTWSDCGDKDAN